MLQFNFNPEKGETPASIAQKRALIAQLMGTPRSPSTLGEGFSALGDGIVANVEGGRARDAETKGQASANSTFSALTGMLTGQGGQTPIRSYGGAPASVPSSADAASIRAGLIKRGLPEHVADGFLMNFQDESGFNSGINEAEPTVPGSRGGYGLYQLTGPRRVAYEQYAQQLGVDPSNVDAQLDFMMSELQGPEARAARAIFAAPDAGSAAAAIATNFLRPAKEHLDARVSRYTSGGASAPVQIASLDPSIGAPAQLPPIGPSGGPPLTAMPQQTTQAAPMAAPAPQQAAPAPVQTAQGPSLQMLMEAAANPWLNDSQKSIINSMIAQEMQKQDPRYAMELQAGQIGLEKSQLELEAMRNPGRKPPIEVGGVLVDPDTFQPVFDSRTPSDNGFTLSPGQQRFDAQGNPIASGAPAPAPRPMSPEDRAMWGIPETDSTPYYLDENGQPKPISGGGQTINVGGNNDIGTIPAGMMVTRDAAGNVTGMQAIPGSPAEREAQAAVDAAQAGTNQASRYGNVVVEDIDRALDVLDQDPTWSTGILGQAMGNFRGSNSDRLNNLLDTVRANSAFDRLQAMRDASPTGGALGAVSERELGLLQSAIGSLETGNAEDLAYNLKRLQTIYSEIIDGPKASAPAQSTVPASDIDALLELYK